MTAAKMHVGHLESAAGAVGLLKAMLMCEQGKVPAFRIDGKGFEPPSHGCHGGLLPLQAWTAWSFDRGCHAGRLKLWLCGQQCPCGDDSSQRLPCSQVREPLHSHPLEALPDSITRAVNHVFTEGFDIRNLLPHIASKAKRWRWRRSRCGRM